MAEVVATEALKLILEKPISHVYKEILFAKDVKSHTKRIQNSKATFEALLLDIKSSELCSHAVQQVLSRFVREFTKFADFVDEKDARAKKQKIAGTSKFVLFFSSSNQFFTRFKDDKKIKSFMRELDFIAKDYALFGTMISTLSMNRTQEFSSLESWPRSKTDLVFGRDKENNDMITILCGSSFDVHESLSIASIVGIGGLGKTTLANYVYNDERVEEFFYLRLWVNCIPHTSYRDILEKIRASILGEKPLNNYEIMVTLQDWILKAIFGKKFLLVLDNMWEREGIRNDWLHLRALLEDGAQGSKVLITSRSEVTAKTLDSLVPYKLNSLGESASWMLLKHCALTRSHELNLEAIGKDIAKLCRNVPLVLRSIGGLLATKHTSREWLAIKDQLSANGIRYGQDIVKILKLSYDQLDKRLQLCVVYCSLFPKGENFDVDQMIRLWIALGYVDVESEIECLEDVAEDYVRNLVDYGFFKQLYLGRNKRMIMHDMMHDLVLFITQSQSNYQMVNSKTKKVDEQVFHVSFDTKDLNWDALNLLFNIKQSLQSILMIYTEFLRPIDDISERFRSGYKRLASRNSHLKVLCLKNLKMKKVPKFVGKLIQLKYLDLSWNDRMYKLGDLILELVNLMFLDMSNCYNLQELPKDMSKLVKLRKLMLNDCFKLRNLPKGLWNLHSLELQRCSNLVELPRDMNKITKLRHLKVDGCDKLSHMPKGIGNVTELQTLSDFVVGLEGDNNGGLNELHDLNSLEGSLTIGVDAEAKYIVSEAAASQMERKDKLLELSIVFSKSTKDDQMIVDGLLHCGIANLRWLKIKGYGGEKLPSWMMTNDLFTRFPKLVSIQVCYYKIHYPLFYIDSKQDIHQNPRKQKTLQIHVGSEQVDEGNVNVHVHEWIPGFSKLQKLKLGYTDMEFKLTEGNQSSSLTLTHQGLRFDGRNNLWLHRSQFHQPDILHDKCFQNLQTLSIWHFSGELKTFPVEFRDLVSLKFLSIYGCGLEALPDWIDNLNLLQEIVISGCYLFKSLPYQIRNLSSLHTLRIECCNLIVEKCRDPTGEYWPYIQHIPNLITMYI